MIAGVGQKLTNRQVQSGEAAEETGGDCSSHRYSCPGALSLLHLSLVLIQPLCLLLYNSLDRSALVLMALSLIQRVVCGVIIQICLLCNIPATGGNHK